MSLVSKNERKRICEEYLAGETQERLAKVYHVSKQRIGQILQLNGLTGKDKPSMNSKSYAGLSISVSVKEALREIAAEREMSMSALAEEVFRKEFGDRVVEEPLAPLPQLQFIEGTAR